MTEAVDAMTGGSLSLNTLGLDSLLGGPEAPDPYATADAQTQANLEAMRQSALLNQMGISMPGYDISYTGEIGDPSRQMTLALSPEKQALADIISGGVSDIGAGAQFMPSFAGVPGMPSVGGFGGEGQRVEDLTYEALMSRIRPEQERIGEQAWTRMNVMGTPIGSEIYGTEMDRLARLQSDQNLQAALTAMQAGQQEQQRLFGQGMATRQQGMSDVAMQSQLPLSNLAQLLSMDPTNIQAPGQPSYQMQPPDIAGLIQGNYATQAGQQQAMLGGLAGLGGAAIFASDRRLKHNLVPRGTMASGVPIYEFSYNGSDERHTGVMAQDVMKIRPGAVEIMSNGYMAVNYGLL